MNQPILVACQTREVVLDGTTYTVQALSYAAVSSLQVEAAARMRPSEAVLNDALARICREAGRADLADGVEQHDAAQDNLGAIFFTRPSEADAEGVKQWHRDRAADLEAAQRQILATERKRTLALHLAQDAPAVQQLRQQAAAFVLGDSLAMVRLGVVAVNGRAVAGDDLDVSAMPASHVTALAKAVREMAAPTESAAKN